MKALFFSALLLYSVECFSIPCFIKIDDERSVDLEKIGVIVGRKPCRIWMVSQTGIEPLDIEMTCYELVSLIKKQCGPSELSSDAL